MKYSIGNDSLRSSQWSKESFHFLMWQNFSSLLTLWDLLSDVSSDSHSVVKSSVPISDPPLLRSSWVVHKISTRARFVTRMCRIWYPWVKALIPTVPWACRIEPVAETRLHKYLQKERCKETELRLWGDASFRAPQCGGTTSGYSHMTQSCMLTGVISCKDN
jgi:hypothetical protein